MRDRDRLIARIRQLRRAKTEADERAPSGARQIESRLDALETRMEHLEHLVEGLQDSVHRESRRQEQLIAELHAQVQPAALSAALSQDARNRGL